MIENISDVQLASEIFGIPEYIYSIMTNTNSHKKIDLLEIEVAKPLFFDFFVKKKINRFKEYILENIDETVEIFFKRKGEK